MSVTAVESTTLAAVAYGGSSQLLCLEFRSGAIYCYFGVPAPIHQGLLSAPSKGSYFNRNIRGRSPFQKLTSDPHNYPRSDSPRMQLP
jgi:hypothetical protein